MLLRTGLYWGRGINRCRYWTASRAINKCCRGRGINGYVLSGVVLCGLFSIIRSPHSDRPLSGFVRLGWLEAGFIKIYMFLLISLLLTSEESKKYYENNGWCMTEHSKYIRSLKRKHPGVRFVQMSTVSMWVIPIRETTIFWKTIDQLGGHRHGISTVLITLRWLWYFRA